MQVFISLNMVTFAEINACQPPDWLDEAILYAAKELDNGTYYIEGNNDKGMIYVVFSENFKATEDKIKEIVEVLEFQSKLAIC